MDTNHDQNKHKRYRFVRLHIPGQPERVARREILPPPKLVWVNPNEPWVTVPYRRQAYDQSPALPKSHLVRPTHPI